MVKLKKGQKFVRKIDRRTGVVIDCIEFTISIFAPPREHGKDHCHVRSKTSRKVRGKELHNGES